MRNRRKLTLMPLACAIGSAFAGGAAQAQPPVLPAGPSVVAGQVNVNAPAAGQLVVNQQSDRAVVNWSSFSLGAGTQVNFVQPGSGSAILNRVTGGAPSSIAGQLNANGQVFLVNPNGIQVTATGSVQAAGLTLSTLDIGDADFLAGRLAFTGNGASAAVSNGGTLSAAPGGYAALLGGQVSNDGRIEVPMGRIGLGSGERATLDLLGGRFLQVALPTAQDAQGRALVEVSGTASAEGGRIEVSAATAREALRQAVNIPGNLVARSVAGRSGDIVLTAGSGGNAAISGQIDVSGGAGARGGNVTITGDSVTLQHAHIDASGATGGGSVQLGGGAQGQGPLPHARQLEMDADSVAKADATVDGGGGRIVLWSDERTGFQGTLTARGAGSGAGGLAEVSSHGLLEYAGRVDLRAERGPTGTLLLDPFDVTISTGADTGACCTATANNTVINTTTLANALASANVTVSTGAAGAQNGDITVANAVSWNSGNALTLSAARDVNVNANITTNGGALTLSAGRAVQVKSAAIRTGGGNLAVTTNSTDATYGLTLNGATIDVGAGTATMSGVSSSGIGVYFTSATNTLSASGSGSITLAGQSTSDSGIAINTDLATTGRVTLGGTSSTFNGLWFLGTTITNAGTLVLNGTSAITNAVWLNGNNPLRLLNTGTGSISLQGTSAGNGVRINTGVGLVTSGPVQISGTSTGTGAGFSLKGNNAVTILSGDTTITGSATSSFAGIDASSAGNSFTNSGTGTLTLGGVNDVVLAGPVSASSGLLSITATRDLVLNSGAQINWASGTTQPLTAGRDITVSAPLSGTGGLQFQAGRNIVLNNNISATSGSLNVTLAASPVDGAVTLNGAAINTGGGSLDISAMRTSAGNALQLIDATLNVGSGTGTITVAASTDATFASGNLQLLASGSGSLALSSNSGSGSGIFFNTNTTLTSAGSVSVAGASNSGIGLYLLGSNSVTAGGGSLSLTGSSASNNGVWFNGGANALTATGGLTIAGMSVDSRGMGFNTGVTIATAGNIGLSGMSVNSEGVWFNSTNGISANNGTLILSGSSIDGNGIFINFGANTISQSGAGSVALNASSGTATALLITNGASLATSGDVTLSGTSGSGWGVGLLGGNTLTATAGSLSIAGNSTSSNGVQFSGSNSLTNAGATGFSIAGTSGSGIGLELGAGAALATSGNLTVSGTATGAGGRGVQFVGASLTVSAGSLALNGSALDNAGIAFNGIGTTSQLVNNGAGLTLSGSSGSGAGIAIDPSHTLQTIGDITLAGSGGAKGISLAAGAVLANNGSGTLHLSTTGGMDLQGDLASPAGALWLTAGGSVTQGGGSLSAANLLLTGAGAYRFDAAGNQLQTVAAANAGSLMLHSATDLATGTVLGTPGIATGGALTLLSDGNLTIAAGAPVSGASPVLSAAGSFFNNAGATALIANSGRWLVYAADPASSSFGGLDSGNTALWNTTYALTPPAGVSAAGNRYLFALQPTLSFTPLDAAKVYGADGTGAIQSSFAVAGYHAGVSNAFVADTAATAYSGAPLLASAGAPATAGVAGSPYALSLSAGTATSPAGYAMNFSAATSNLVVTPRPITVSADAQIRVYGEPNPPLTWRVSTGSLVNGDLVGGSLATPATAASPAGSYGIARGTLDAGANYALAYVPASLTVTPPATMVGGDVARHVYTDPSLVPRYGNGEDPLLGTSFQTQGSITPADPERYVVLAVDDLPQPALLRAAPGLAEHVQASHQLQSGGAAQVMALLERAHGLQRIATWPLPTLRALCVLYRLPDGVARETLIDSLARHPHVRVAQALQEFAPLSDADAPRYNDPYVGLQRGFAEIGAARAHRLSVGRDVPIAVVDTAVDVDHPDLRGRIADSRDLVDAPKSAELRQARHGTQVAGIIGAAANNGQGIVGVAPAAQLSFYRACWYPADSRVARCNTFTLAKALATVLQSRARIVNLSLGGPTDALLEMLTRRLIEQGRIVVAALPPSDRTEGFPAGVPGVLVAGSSENGAMPAGVLGAPGRDVLTLAPGGSYDFETGSSLAAAHLSGAVALLLAIDRSLSAADIRALLVSSSGGRQGGGINVDAAVSMLDRQRQYAASRQP